jgi:hypothetical protein
MRQLQPVAKIMDEWQWVLASLLSLARCQHSTFTGLWLLRFAADGASSKLIRISSISQ